MTDRDPILTQHAELDEAIWGMASTKVVKLIEKIGDQDAFGPNTIASMVKVGSGNNKYYLRIEADQLPNNTSNGQLISYEWEDSISSWVKVEKEMYGASPDLTPGANSKASSEVSVEQTSQNRWIKISRSLSDNDIYTGTVTFQEFVNVKYYFPRWLVRDRPFGLNINQNNAVSVYPNVRGGIELTVPARQETSYHVLQPASDDIFSFRDKDIDIRFTDIAYIAPKVICNDICFVTGTNQIAIVPQTYPNANDYVTMMQQGTEILIGSDSARWKYNLWKQTKTFLPIPDLTQVFNPIIA